ncbi:MAG: retropepsin-like aspartic protease [Kofleriaceae bacterium]
MARWVAMVVVMLGCAKPPPAPQFPGGIEEQLVEDASNSVIVPVRVNGRSLRFILDSGATISALTPATATALGITPVGKGVVNDAITPIAIVDRLAIGSAEHRDVRVAVIDLPAAKRMDVTYDGILGLDVLGRYDVVIDFAQRRLALHPIGHVSRTQASHDMARVKFRPSPHGLVLMTADVEFIPINAVLDLGAQYSLVNRAACAMGGVTVGTMSRLSHVHVGDVDLGTWKMLVGDLPIFSRSGLMPGPAIVLGADVFAHRTVVLAYRSRTVYVSKSR